jgi:cellulose synthase/poly-beta-1,6-N-acetylglucosamine synthase-like glycosyltransferase
MTISVLVPSYRRPEDLERCLIALAGQHRLPDEVILVSRKGDQATLELAINWRASLPLAIIEVDLPGQVNALNAGLDVVRHTIVAITDDDAAPRPEWLARIEARFDNDLRLGGVGGRDWLHKDGKIDGRMRSPVGKILWFGRLVGNHHLGAGPPRDVDVLKGANMSYRMSALAGIRFDPSLRGNGAQVCNDLAFSLAVKAAGWKLVYDPAVEVDHYPASRFDLDQRNMFHPQAVEDEAFNRYWAMNQSLSPRWKRKMALLWQHAVGTEATPGAIHVLRGFLRQDPEAVGRWKRASRGRTAAHCVKRPPYSWKGNH